MSEQKLDLSPRGNLLFAIENGQITDAAFRLETEPVNIGEIRDELKADPTLLPAAMGAIKLLRNEATAELNKRVLSALCLGAGGALWEKFIELEEVAFKKLKSFQEPKTKIRETRATYEEKLEAKQSLELRNIAICELVRAGWSLQSVGDAFGVSRMRVSQVCKDLGVEVTKSFGGDHSKGA